MKKFKKISSMGSQLSKKKQIVQILFLFLFLINGDLLIENERIEAISSPKIDG